MTHKQFVKKKFPKAELEYRIGNRNFIDSYYRIWSDGLYRGVEIARGRTSKSAWKMAKQFILDI